MSLLLHFTEKKYFDKIKNKHLWMKCKDVEGDNVKI